jgi:hypothetical protein
VLSVSLSTALLVVIVVVARGSTEFYLVVEHVPASVQVVPYKGIW